MWKVECLSTSLKQAVSENLSSFLSHFSVLHRNVFCNIYLISSHNLGYKQQTISTDCSDYSYLFHNVVNINLIKRTVGYD